ncbi:MAG: polysaccharide biosynthesis C-terminal domain-containing protein [Ferruginibacter sp.]|nr:polysaccharide biosynthesis C-terminal domain-containing protein [Ferruginibacter sp.]
MSSIKKLAGETMWYGGSTIAARFLNYLLTPFLTYNMANTSDYGKIGLIYSLIPVFNVLFTYGVETAYFRFGGNNEKNKNIYSTAALSLFFSTVFFTGILWLNKHLLGQSIGLEEFPAIIKLMILIIAVDTLAAIPFAKLRQESRPVKYAAAKIVGIVANIILTLFFIKFCPDNYKKYEWIDLVYDPSINEVTYVVFANLIQSVITLLFLFREIFQIRFAFNVQLWKQMMLYALPLILVGMGGVINDTMNRIMLRWWLPGTEAFRESQVGIFNACAKLAILITLFVQAFKMSAEPFFFKQAEAGNPQRVYARIMKFFVIILSVMFLAVSLFIPIWKYFIGPKYWQGLGVVPILLMANIFLGIYYNLTVWYKLSNKTIYGAWITLFGSAISVLINYIFIPHFGLMACAWGTFAAYGSMLLLSNYFGQKYYRIPYTWKKLIAYLVIVTVIFFIHKGITHFYSNKYFSFAIATLLLFIYCRFIALVEHKEFAKLPVVGKYFLRKNETV